MPTPGRSILCSPRHQNVLDLVDYLIQRGFLGKGTLCGYRATAKVPPQRGAVDIGLGLCGQGGRRLAGSLSAVTCPDCLLLLAPALADAMSAP